MQVVRHDAVDRDRTLIAIPCVNEHFTKSSMKFHREPTGCSFLKTESPMDGADASIRGLLQSWQVSTDWWHAGGISLPVKWRKIHALTGAATWPRSRRRKAVEGDLPNAVLGYSSTPSYPRPFHDHSERMSLSPAPREASPPREPMPPGIHYVYFYEVFNTASWSVVLGSPMLLFFQHLNASATILAIAASLPPILTMLQIPAAHFVEKVGYRRFVLSGWTTRSFIVLGMTGVAFLPDSIGLATRMVLMLSLSLVYNILRGISTCGFLPWFTLIVPESRRGEFLAKDQAASALAAVTCLFLFGSLLHVHDHWPSFGILFLFSAVAAFVSLTYLRRIPDVPVEKISKNPEPMPWRDMITYPPFAKYVRYNVVINIALGSSNVFWVRFFRLFLHVSNSNILFVASFSTGILALGLFLVGSIIDRAGNKPALTVSGLFFAAHFAGWACVAAGVIPFTLPFLGYQLFLSGIGASLWNLANVRMVMGIVPHMGRPHFLALYTVASNLTVGVVPLLWGPVMDGTKSWTFTMGFWQWNSYSMFYCALVLAIGAGLFLLRSVVEPITMTWDAFITELLVKTPSRAVSRLIGRLRGPSIG
jgi:MFS family permease